MDHEEKKTNLTEESVDAAEYDPAGPVVQYLWDTKTTGFGIRLYPSGKKSYVVGYRPKAGGRMRFAIFGKVGIEKVKPARAKAKLILANNRDPVAEKKDAISQAMGQEFEDKRNPTLSRLVDNYFEYQEQRLRSALEQGTGKHLSRQSIDQYRWTIEKYIRPAWPEIPIKNIQRADVKSLVREVAKENTEYVANGVLMRIRGLMRFALDDDLIEHDPSRDVRTD